MPFVHAHPDDHGTSHHAAHAVHAHFSLHTVSHQHAPTPVFDDDDRDRPVYLQLYLAVGSKAPQLGPALTMAVDLAAPADVWAPRSGIVVKGHDPPFHRSLPSRAPPRFLS